MNMEDVVADDEAEIRGPTERWVRAVHTGDMSGVLADHSDRMFDLPYEGVRGIDAYSEMWPGFFEWQAQGATFELTSLDVTVAFAHARLRPSTTTRRATGPPPTTYPRPV